MAAINCERDAENMYLNSKVYNPTTTDGESIHETPIDQTPLGLRPRAIFRQFLIVIIANLSILAPAMGLGYSSVALIQLTKPEDPFYLDPNEASWFASINAIACPVGGILNAYLLDKLGRKPTIFIINITSIVSWGLMGTSYQTNFAIKFTQVIIARFIIGIASGLSSSAVSVYSAEICHPNFRGRLTLGSSAATATGIFAMFGLGCFIRDDWRLLAQIACGFSMFTLMLTFLIPESPTWLIVKDRIEESRKSFWFFRGRSSKNSPYSTELEHEFNTLQKSLALNEGDPTPRFWQAIGAPEVYKPLLIMIGFFACQQFSGVFVVVVYAAQISIEAGVTIDPILCATLVAFIRVPTTLAVGLVLDRWGRRPPAMFSGFGMGISMFILAASVWYPSSIGSVTHLPLICICMYIITSTLGLMTLPFSMIGEVFPQRMRGTAAGITISCNYALSFLCVKLFPTMVAQMGKASVFAFYGTSGFLAIGFLYCFLPETKGKTLFEISEEFKGSKRIKTTIPLLDIEQQRRQSGN